jgi:hypothetical protein
MKPRYVVINERERDAFEKKHQIPYGYSDCDIHTDFEDAMDEFETYGNNLLKEYIIERIDQNGREVVYRGGL